MKRWVPQTPAPHPQRWQSRAEILKAHLDSLAPDELIQVRPDYYFWRYGPQSRNARKYDPNQPRVAAGNPDGGQWTSEGGDQASGDSLFRGIFGKARQYAASKMSLNACIALCAPLLERRQPPGSDRNEFDFRKCLNRCLGRLGQ